MIFRIPIYIGGQLGGVEINVNRYMRLYDFETVVFEAIVKQLAMC